MNTQAALLKVSLTVIIMALIAHEGWLGFEMGKVAAQSVGMFLGVWFCWNEKEE